MRSFTTADLPGRCKRCWVVLAHCVCARVPRVEPRTGVVVVRHLRESWKSTGTVRVASLAVPSLTCLDYGEDAEPAASALPALATPGTYVLLPQESPEPVEPGAVKRLVVLDGTWRQARRMYQRLPALHGLPRLTLTAPARAVVRLRGSSFEAGRSTLEAIAEALALVEGEAVAAPLLQLHDTFVEAVLRARGMWETRRLG